MPDTIDARTDLVELSPLTPPGLGVTQRICEERAERDGPFAERFVTDHNAALVEQFLDIPVSQRKTVDSQTACWMMLIGKRWREGLTSGTDSQPTWNQ
jgi:hypothetical protein